MLNYKRLLVQASAVLLAGLALLSVLFIAIAASPLRVCPEGCANASLQEAVINASPEDTIVVESGVYTDPLIIGRQVRLQGQDTGSGRPRLDPEKGRVILAAEGTVLLSFDFSSAPPNTEESNDCSLEVILPATIYLNEFSGRSTVCPEDVAAWNSSESISYMFNSRVLRSPLGNYWNDYHGTDEDGDGIGDEPVILNEDNIDYYPLILPLDSYLISDATGASERSQTEVIQAQVGDAFEIPLSANPTTGYSWDVDYDSALLSLNSSEYRASSPQALGSAGRSIFIFEPLKPGKTTIYFVYKRPWENIVAEARAFQVDISA